MALMFQRVTIFKKIILEGIYAIYSTPMILSQIGKNELISVSAGVEITQF